MKIRAREILARAEGDNSDKFYVGWQFIENATTLEEYDCAVLRAKVSNGVKKRLMETR